MSKFTNTIINTGAFFLISLLETFGLTSNIINTLFEGNLKQCSGPTHFVQTIIFIIIIFAIVTLLNMFAFDNKRTIWYYMKYAFYSGIVYYFMSNLGTYEISNILTPYINVFNGSNGCPTIPGLILHSIIFFFLHLVLV